MGFNSGFKGLKFRKWRKNDKNVGYTCTYTELRNGAGFANCKIRVH